jgi:hypothetical protein
MGEIVEALLGSGLPKLRSVNILSITKQNASTYQVEAFFIQPTLFLLEKPYRHSHSSSPAKMARI